MRKMHVKMSKSITYITKAKNHFLLTLQMNIKFFHRIFHVYSALFSCAHPKH